MANNQKPLNNNPAGSHARNAYDDLRDKYAALLQKDPLEYYIQAVATPKKSVEHDENSTEHNAPEQQKQKEQLTTPQTEENVTTVETTNIPEESVVTVDKPVFEEPEFEVVQRYEETQVTSTDDSTGPYTETVMETSSEEAASQPDNHTVDYQASSSRKLVANALRIAAIVAGMAIVMNYWGKKEKPLFAQENDNLNGTEQLDNQASTRETLTENAAQITAIKPEVKASAKAKVDKEAVKLPTNNRFGYGNTMFDPVTYDKIFIKKGKREAGGDYSQSFYKDGTMAGGKYQFLPPVLALEPYGLLTRIEKNPIHPDDVKAKEIRKWVKSQSDTARYMTIYNDNRQQYEHYQWTGKHNINCAQDYYNDHNLQEYYVRVMYERNYRGFQGFVNKRQDVTKDSDGDYNIHYNGTTIPLTPYAIGFGFHFAGYGNGIAELFPDNGLNADGSNIQSKLSQKSKKIFLEYLEYGYDLGKRVEGSALTFKDKVKTIKRQENERKDIALPIKALQDSKIELTASDSIKTRIEANGMKIELN